MYRPARWALLNCLAGVDEAGLGPILGPLVVSGVALEGPAGLTPWRSLRSVVSRHRHEKGKIRVADSKNVYQGAHRLERLEETVLSFCGALTGDIPENLGGWLRSLGADLDALGRCPWYGDLDLPLPLHADRDRITLQAHLLGRTMARRRTRILHLVVRVVDVEEFNQLIADTDNKSRAHFKAYSEVIAQLLRLMPAPVHLVADRCGGRTHYRAGLHSTCPGHDVEILQETSTASVYRLRGGTEPVTVTFASRGEDRAFPTALASCTAKYVRELMIHLLNRWFCARVPGLKPTAGYYVDGKRFLRDLKPFMESAEVPISRLVRVR